MAKGNMLLGQARGSVGDLVFSRNNGKQVIRAKSATVKNPQSDAQVLQRTILNTISQAYSKMINIVDHSYEGFKVGQDQMSQFMKINIRMMRAKVSEYQASAGTLAGIYSFTPIGSKELSINPYIVALGSLPTVQVSKIDLSNESDQCAVLPLPGISGIPSYADIISAFGLQRGDQLTFCTMNYDATNGMTFQYARVILDPVNADMTDADLSTQLITDGAVTLPSERNEGTFGRLSAANGVIRFSVGSSTPVAACVIVSRQKTDGTWLRSNATLVTVKEPATYGQYDLLQAMNAFYSGGIYLESNYYLNNAIGGVTDSSNASTEAYLTELSMNGTSVLASSATAYLANNANPALSFIMAYIGGSVEPRLVVTTRSLTFGADYTENEADQVFAIENTSGNFAPELTAGTTYNIFFINKGVVKAICGHVLKAAASVEPTVTAVTLGENDMSSADAAAIEININTATAVSVTVSNVSDLTDPQLVAMSQGLSVGTNAASLTKRQSLALTAETTTGSWTGTTAGEYQMYILSNGIVAKVLRKYKAIDPNGGDGGDSGLED